MDNSASASPAGPAITGNGSTPPPAPPASGGVIASGADNTAPPAASSASPASGNSTGPAASDFRFTGNPSTNFRSTARGDIILPTDKPAKGRGGNGGSKKPLIIALIALVITGVIAAIAFAVLGGAKSGGSAESSDATATQSFRTYANYLLYGEESDKELGEWDEFSGYKLDEMLSILGESEEKSQYFNALNTKFDDFISRYQATGSSNEVITDYQNQFKFIYAYATAPALDETDFIEKYLADGSEAAKEYATKALEPLSQLDSEAAKNYVDAATKYYLTGLIALLDAYQSAGCIADGAINEECATSIEQQSNTIDNIELISPDHIISDVAATLTSTCWEIDQVLTGAAE